MMKVTTENTENTEFLWGNSFRGYALAPRGKLKPKERKNGTPMLRCRSVFSVCSVVPFR